MSRNSSWVNKVGNTKQKTGGSSQVVNMESWVTENSANMESQVVENSAKMESRAMKNSANTESRVTKNLDNMENQVMQDSGGKNPEEGKGDVPSKRPAP
jgi:hypothetical protein